MECDTKSEITAKNVTHRKHIKNIKWFWFDPIEVNVYGSQHKNEFNATNHMTQWSKQISVPGKHTLTHSHKHRYMVLTTQHAFKTFAKRLSYHPLIQQESPLQILLKNHRIEIQQQFHFNEREIEAYSSCSNFVTICFAFFFCSRAFYTLQNNFDFLLFIVLMLLLLLLVLSFSSFLFIFIQFIIICFELSHVSL